MVIEMLYVIQAANGPIKIGVSDNVPKRMAALQTSNPSALTLCGTVNPDDDYKTESKAHRYLCEHRMEGEWFENTHEVCEYLIKIMKSKIGALHVPPIQNNWRPLVEKQTNNDEIHDRYLRIKDVISKTGLTKSTIYEMIKTRRFPAQIKMGTRVSAWSEHELNMWIIQRKQVNVNSA